MDLSILNDAAAALCDAKQDSSLHQMLLHCCGSKRWVTEMLTKFPVHDFEELCQAADAVDVTLTREDWLEAFAAHSRIGRAKKPIKEWEAQEQKATKDADEDVLDRLEALNDAYYKKFGYIYIVCATGKSAREMLRILESRMDNSPEEELSVAASEQSKITKLRLEKLVQGIKVGFRPNPNWHNHIRTIIMPHVPEELARKLRAAGQGHVLKFDDADKLSPSEAQEFTKELEALDLELLQKIFHASTQAENAETGTIEPLESYDLLEQCSAQDKERWMNLGMESISWGQVCALVLSGGQGTRLGFAGPKGMYDIGLPSEKSLFQLFAERLLALEVLAADKFPTVSREEIQIPFYVMTSKMNHDTTVGFFRKHKFFGLKESQMFFFPQGTLPCFTLDGKLILENASKLATASDGNGGIYKAMESSGALTKLQACGVKYLHVFSVDNALCKAADPTFIGYCIDKQADCGNKVVWKTRPDDSVGVVAKRNDRFCVIEYSEIDREMSERVDSRTGKLVFGAANICNHFYTIDFLVDVVLPNMSLKYHVAHKKIPMADDTGATYTPTSNSGIKLESFIFDVFPLSSRMAVLSVPRETEFAPVKNPSGNSVDSPDSARYMMHAQGKAWILAAATAISSAEEVDMFVHEKLGKARYIEISPLVSYSGEGLEAYIKSLMEGLPRDIIRLESSKYMASANSVPTTIRQAFDKSGQGHVFRFVDAGKVNAHEACELVEALRQIDLLQIVDLFERSTNADNAEKKAVDELLPLEEGVVHQLSETAPELKTKWHDLGLEAVSKGMAGALILDGGQGTRLGFAGPKGMYDIGLPSGKSLFEIFAQRVVKVQKLAEARFNLAESPKIPLLIMTSEMNHETTVSFFQKNNFFGLSRDQLHFFCQGSLPCFTENGKLILETMSQLARASDGNGGIYPALKRNGVLGLLGEQNVQYLHVFSVDNVLCKVADPVFIGYCIDQDADCANKVVWKTRPDESVGVVAKRNGTYCVVEYSELDRAASEQVDSSTGKLSFGAATVCNHMFRLDFLQRCCNRTDAEYHVAKKIPYVNDAGTATITPTSNTGIKLETFIFDVFPLSKSMKVLGVSREDEFAPVKNAPGAACGSPDSARHLVSEQGKRWLLHAGANFEDSASDAICEILPSLSYNGEGLEEVARLNSPIRLPIVLGQD